MPDSPLDDLRAAYNDLLRELDELGEVWVEHHAGRRATDQIGIAIDQAIRESRKVEKKLRKHG